MIILNLFIGIIMNSMSEMHAELAERDRAQHERETWRGELCHWCAFGCAPLFFLWNPWWADLIMITYAVAANLPCILPQRYNRLRFQQLLARRS